MTSRPTTFKTFAFEGDIASASEISIIRTDCEAANTKLVIARHIQTKFCRAIDYNQVKGGKDSCSVLSHLLAKVDLFALEPTYFFVACGNCLSSCLPNLRADFTLESLLST